MAYTMSKSTSLAITDTHHTISLFSGVMKDSLIRIVQVGQQASTPVLEYSIPLFHGYAGNSQTIVPR